MSKIYKFLLGSIATLSLAACGTDTAKDTNDVEQGEEVTITYAIWDTNQEPGMKKMAERFTELNPEIKVNVEVTPWEQYWTKLNAGATGESMPDVFWMHSNESYRYMSSDILVDLSENFDVSKYPESITELYSYEGKQYAIPKDMDTIGLWYNKSIFDSAGLEYPDDTWTWDTLLEVAQELHDPENDVYGFAAPNNGHSGYWNFIFQNEGKIMSDDRESSEYTNENTVEAITFYNDLINKYKVTPSMEQLAENDHVSFMESGRAAMSFQGSWMISAFKSNEYLVENTDVAVLPKGKVRASVYNGLGNAVSNFTENKEAALKFVEFLGSEEANLISAEEGSAIPAYEGTAENWAKNIPEFNVQVFVDMMDYAVIRPFSKATIRIEELERDRMGELFAQQKTVEETVEAIESQANEILANE